MPISESRRNGQKTPSALGQPFFNTAAAMTPLKAICDDCLRAYVAMSAEMLRFCQMRAKKDFDLWQDLTGGKEPMQAYARHWRFCGELMDDYMDEAAKLYALANQTDEPGAGETTGTRARSARPPEAARDEAAADNNSLAPGERHAHAIPINNALGVSNGSRCPG